MASRVMILLNGRLLTADALQENANGRVLRLGAAASEAAIRSALSAITSVRGIVAVPDSGTDPACYLIEAEARPSLAADIVATLVGGGIAVSELTEVPADLERVFLDLTRQPLKDTA
jgi:ABC-2 type transport system ATP-binding protein